MNKKNDSKMNCSLCRNMIDDYLEARLEEEERLYFEQHINLCAECSELLKIQELSDKIILSEKNLTPGYFLTGRIMSGIESYEVHKESAIIRILRPVLMTISFAAAIFTGVVAGNYSSLPPDNQVPIELTLMNDNEIEFLEVLTIE